MGEQRERRRVVRGLTRRPRSPDIVRVMGLAAQAQFAERAGDDGGARPAESAYGNRRIPSLIRGRPPAPSRPRTAVAAGPPAQADPAPHPRASCAASTGRDAPAWNVPARSIINVACAYGPAIALLALPTVAPFVMGSFAASASISPFAIHGRRHSIGVRYPEATPFCNAARKPLVCLAGIAGNCQCSVGWGVVREPKESETT
jgi:hypothetical protein